MNPRALFIIALCGLAFAAGTSNGFAAPSFAGTTKQAIFISPLETSMSTWAIESQILQLERAGYHVDVVLDGNATISFFETGLSNYDLIVLRTDAFTWEGLRYYCAGDHPDNKARAALSGMIALKEVQVAACVGFNMLFLRHYYPAGSLRSGLVIMPSSFSAEIASVFLQAGAAAFIGYNEGHCMQWGYLDSFSLKILYYLSKGYSVADTMIQLYIYLHTGHGKSADWMMPESFGDGTYKI